MGKVIETENQYIFFTSESISKPFSFSKDFLLDIRIDRNSKQNMDRKNLSIVTNGFIRSEGHQPSKCYQKTFK